MAETTALGFTKLLPNQPLSLNDYAFAWSDRELLDRLLTMLMNHSHNGLTMGPSAPSATTATETGIGGLDSGTTYYYKVTQFDADDIESPASVSTWVETTGLLDAITMDTGDFSIVTTGGTLPAGVYQYAVTVWHGSYAYDTHCPSPITVVLSVADGNAQKVEITLPALPVGAEGFNIYRRFPNSTTFNLITTLTGEQVSPYVDNDATPEPSAITLSTTNRSSHGSTVQLTRPSGTTKWGIYRSTDDSDWQGTFLTTSEAATYDDTGDVATFAGPPPDSTPYTNPDPVIATEIRETPHVVTLQKSGAATTGVLGEWINPFDNAFLAGAVIQFDNGTTPTGATYDGAIQVWNGATWDSLMTFSVGTTLSELSMDASTASSHLIDSMARVRVNITQVGGSETGPTVHLRLWVTSSTLTDWTTVNWAEV